MAHVKRFEERFAERGERIKQIVATAEGIDRTFVKQLNTFRTSATIFDSTKTALLTGSGELEIF